MHRKEGDANLLATRPVYTTTKTETILEALEKIAKYNVRVLPVVNPANQKLEGIVTTMDFVNYLGGGDYYNIVVNRHGGDLISALRKEHIESIMNPNPYFVTVADKLKTIIEKMVLNNVGVLPVVFDDGTIWGIITEHDLVRHLAEKTVGKRVEDVMSENVIYISSSAALGDALKTMVRYRVRRLPIVEEDGHVWGMITAKDVVRFFGSHDVFRYTTTNRFEEVLSIPVKVVGAPVYYTIKPKADIGEAATLMIEKNVSSLLVVENSKLVGIITERDILYGLATT
ncbi:MAG TPA: CBS domain-containing protein [Pyrodictiaceae archaeon]|nr:CBS domain-containing protein [Pyrodictiaceae archaeon]